MANTYADLAMLKAPGSLNITGTSYDARLLALLGAASRWIDGYCNRHFYLLQAARRFCGRRMAVSAPGLVRLDSLKTDRDGDGVFETALSAGDYRLEPANADPSHLWGFPYRRVIAAGALAKRGGFPTGAAAMEITGAWGYREVWEDTGARLDAGQMVTAGASVLAVAGDGVAGLAAGQTLLLNTEQVYVAAVTETGVVVRRAVNGTAAASHLGGSALSRFVYPPPVTEACLHLAMRAWQGRGPEGGDVAELCRPPDAVVAGLLAGYRRLAVG